VWRIGWLAADISNFIYLFIDVQSVPEEQRTGGELASVSRSELSLIKRWGEHEKAKDGQVMLVWLDKRVQGQLNKRSSRIDRFRSPQHAAIGWAISPSQKQAAATQ